MISKDLVLNFRILKQPLVGYKIDVLKKFAKFTRKHLCRKKKRLQHKCFSVNFAKNFKNTFFKDTFK